MSTPLDNFSLALSKLLQFLKECDGGELDRAGVIQAFEYSFEQCWKSLQKIAGEEGLNLNSPKKAFEWAFSSGWQKS